MSFILRARPAFRPATRLFSTSIPRLNVVDGAKDVLKKVDRTVSDVAVKGIEVSQDAAAAAKDTVGINAQKAKATADEVAGEAKGKTAELKGEAKGKAEEVKGEVKAKV